MLKSQQRKVRHMIEQVRRTCVRLCKANTLSPCLYLCRIYWLCVCLLVCSSRTLAWWSRRGTAWSKSWRRKWLSWRLRWELLIVFSYEKWFYGLWRVRVKWKWGKKDITSQQRGDMKERSCIHCCFFSYWCHVIWPLTSGVCRTERCMIRWTTSWEDKGQIPTFHQSATPRLSIGNLFCASSSDFFHSRHKALSSSCIVPKYGFYFDEWDLSKLTRANDLMLQISACYLQIWWIGTQKTVDANSHSNNHLLLLMISIRYILDTDGLFYCVSIYKQLISLLVPSVNQSSRPTHPTNRSLSSKSSRSSHEVTEPPNLFTADWNQTAAL